jgi:NitT/TauT family transport system permease protein
MLDRTEMPAGDAAPATRPVRFRGGGFSPKTSRYAGWTALALLLGLWQLAGSLSLVNPLFLPTPVAIGHALYQLAISGALWQHVSVSLMRIGAGWVLGTASGIVVGFAIGLSRIARSVGITFVSALFPIPKIAVLPLLILWLGIGEASKIATIALGVFFPTVIAVYAGIDGVPRNLIAMAQSFNVPRRAILGKVVLPGALPSIIAGFRITSSTALSLLVSAEMIGAQWGIGAFVLQAGNMMQTDQLLAGVTVLSVLGLLISFGLSRLEARLLRWR